MAYKLIQLEQGVILTGDALKARLTGFTIPELPPPLMTYQELQNLKPNIADYQPNTPTNQQRYYADWTAWRFGPVVDYWTRVQERETACKQFALQLRSQFLIGRLRAGGVVVLSTADMYLSFAKQLTELDFPFKHGDKINWICYGSIG